MKRHVHAGTQPTAQGQKGEAKAESREGTHTPKRGSQQPARTEKRKSRREGDRTEDEAQEIEATTWKLHRQELLRNDDMDAPVSYGYQSFRSW